MDDLNKLSKRNVIDDQRVYMIGKRYKKRKNQLVRINRVDSDTLGLTVSIKFMVSPFHQYYFYELF